MSHLPNGRASPVYLCHQWIINIDLHKSIVSLQFGGNKNNTFFNLWLVKGKELMSFWENT